MSAIAKVTKAPCRADAERAAALLVSAGVSRVMLFGSVARGEATEDSDIDLVAIYDDLDYADRFARKRELSRLAGNAVEHSVDVLVTDRPEWKARSERVPTSLESWVDRDGIVLIDRGVGEVDWAKEMVLPVSGYEAAVRRLSEVAEAIATVDGHLTPEDLERTMRDLGRHDTASRLMLARLKNACGQVQRAVESSVKALAHAAGRRRYLGGHDIRDLCDKLTEPHRSEIVTRLVPVGADEITRWHLESRYALAEQDRGEPATPDQVRVLAAVACSVVSYTAEQFDESVPHTDLIGLAVESVMGRIADYDLELGTPLPPRPRDAGPTR